MSQPYLVLDLPFLSAICHKWKYPTALSTCSSAWFKCFVWGFLLQQHCIYSRIKSCGFGAILNSYDGGTNSFIQGPCWIPVILNCVYTEFTVWHDRLATYFICTVLDSWPGANSTKHCSFTITSGATWLRYFISNEICHYTSCLLLYCFQSGERMQWMN